MKIKRTRLPIGRTQDPYGPTSPIPPRKGRGSFKPMGGGKKIKASIGKSKPLSGRRYY